MEAKKNSIYTTWANLPTAALQEKHERWMMLCEHALFANFRAKVEWEWMNAAMKEWMDGWARRAMNYAQVGNRHPHRINYIGAKISNVQNQFCRTFASIYRGKNLSWTTRRALFSSNATAANGNLAWHIFYPRSGWTKLNLPHFNLHSLFTILRFKSKLCSLSSSIPY